MRVVENLDLTEYNNYKVKAHCRLAYFPDTEEEIIELYKKAKTPYILLGSGHNLILSKPQYNESFIILNGNFNRVKIDQHGVLEAEAGAFTKDICELALNQGFSGLEMFYDIPSSVGGAIIMNAGSSGEEIKDILIKTRYIDLENGRIKEIYNKDINFEYRNSYFQKNTNNVVLKAWIQLQKGDEKSIKNKMEAIKERRWAKQPRNYPNCGSVFKRPKGHYVGPMLDELGLKGFSIGGAQVSKKHSGFIVNFDNATGQDILSIITEVQKRVKQKFSVNLEVEQRII